MTVQTPAIPDVPCERCGLLAIDSAGQLLTGHQAIEERAGVCRIAIWDPKAPRTSGPVAEVFSSALTEVRAAVSLLQRQQRTGASP